ncbi:phosphate transport system substrate-binding protein [Malonomonas rubra DSM 5091]|uniref:Phosphate transport system substrate-binding protein n=1 Tax=Malonomonas rubra DSM 5091 TaxID=1122189 RepID=A0A1M6LP16_MALRU|nr:substrate-binding domain-containing protein [Malonomonas rubra]SHJ72951.1 phosphate transport system substrate-binding protein [Malonomonas rubra DSM 5091]
MKFAAFFFLRSLLLGCLLIASYSSFAFADTITVSGTGDSQHLLRQIAQAFEHNNPQSKILVPNSVGSGGGIKLLQADRTELARIARPLKPKEQAEGLKYRTFAYAPVVFVANLPEQCFEDISTENFLAILRGEINNWSQLGNCPDNKIYIANREEGDSSKSVLERVIPQINEIANPAGRTIYSTPEAYDTLNRYPYSFGYLPKSQVHKGNLTMLKFDGTEATNSNVQQGSYPLVVPLGIVWKGTPTGTTKAFLDFLFGEEAKAIMVKLGAVPAADK